MIRTRISQRAANVPGRPQGIAPTMLQGGLYIVKLMVLSTSTV